jgi:hypothetical protein
LKAHRHSTGFSFGCPCKGRLVIFSKPAVSSDAAGFFRFVNSSQWSITSDVGLLREPATVLVKKLGRATGAFDMFRVPLTWSTFDELGCPKPNSNANSHLLWCPRWGTF